MKKITAMALVTIMLLSAGTAFAASQINFSGTFNVYYENDGNFSVNGFNQRIPFVDANGNFYQSAEARRYQNYVDGDTDSYFMNKLQMNIDFQATDEISIHTQWRSFNYDRWGSRDTANFISRYVSAR